MLTGVPNQDSDNTDEYGFTAQPRLAIYVDGTAAKAEEVLAAVAACTQPPPSSIRLQEANPKPGAPKPATPTQVFIATGPPQQLFTLFEYPTLQLNIGGTHRSAVILRPRHRQRLVQTG
jgi:hypothetical protein